MLTIARLSPVCPTAPQLLLTADETLAVWITIYTHYLFPGRWPPGVGTRTRHILILEIFLFSSVFAALLTAGHWWSLNMSDPATFCHAPLPFYWKPQVTCAGQQRSGAVTTGQGRCRQIFYLVCTHTAEYGSGGSGTQTCLPYFGVKLSCVCLMFAYRK